MWFDGTMIDTTRALQEQTLAFWATLGSFSLGAIAALVVFWNGVRPFAGDGSVVVVAAIISAVVAALAFVVSSLLHRRGETQFMPTWQKWVSHLSFVALTAAFGGVTGLSVLLAGQLLGTGLPGLELGAIGGALVTGVATALGGRLAFQAATDLGTSDLAVLLFTFLLVGTVVAMLTEAEPTWWERNYSQLGIGDAAWAFNGTLVVAGLLVGTIGSYIGRDLHRLLDDSAIPKIATVVGIWVLAGLALAAVGWFPLDTQPVPHLIAAFAALALLIGAAGWTQYVLPSTPFVLKAVTTLVVVLVTVALLLTFAFPVLTATALESAVVGLALLWLTTFVRVLSILTPNRSVASQRHHLLQRHPR